MSESNPTDRSSGPGVHIPPPLVYVAGFLLGVVLRWMAPVDRLPGRLVVAAQVVGVGMMALALLLGAWAMLTFGRARTAILPFKPASTLVTSGPYRFTRNPMYLAMAILYLGLSLTLNRLWPIALLPIVILIIDRYVIAREQQHLCARFGESYATYRRRVGRWITLPRMR